MNHMNRLFLLMLTHDDTPPFYNSFPDFVTKEWAEVTEGKAYSDFQGALDLNDLVRWGEEVVG